MKILDGIIAGIPAHGVPTCPDSDRALKDMIQMRRDDYGLLKECRTCVGAAACGQAAAPNVTQFYCAARQQAAKGKNTKVCSRCRRNLPVTEFYVRKDGGLNAWCKPCVKEYKKGYYVGKSAKSAKSAKGDNR